MCGWQARKLTPETVLTAVQLISAKGNKCCLWINIEQVCEKHFKKKGWPVGCTLLNSRTHLEKQCWLSPPGDCEPADTA